MTDEPNEPQPVFHRWVRAAFEVEVEVVDRTALETTMIDIDDTGNVVLQGIPGPHRYDYAVALAVTDAIRKSGYAAHLKRVGLQPFSDGPLPRFRDETGEMYEAIPAFPARADDGSVPGIDGQGG
ncbi:hypothetical protein [Cellulosimicrobium sp. CpK407]|uniref:hypothetical protein n=1 Tax=Cellulosimicrobium sp. CpK407 TaxID=3229847 RepID=UPI003F31C3B3